MHDNPYVCSETLVFEVGADGCLETSLQCRYIYVGPSISDDRLDEHSEAEDVVEFNDLDVVEFNDVVGFNDLDVDKLLAQKMLRMQKKRMFEEVSKMYPDGVPEYVKQWTLYLADTDRKNDACGSQL